MANCKHSFCIQNFLIILILITYSHGKIFPFKEKAFQSTLLSKSSPGVKGANGQRRFVRDVSSEEGSAPSADVAEFSHHDHNQAVLHWSGKKSNRMFMLTRKTERNGSVFDSVTYRSENYGSSFDVVDNQIRGKNRSIVITSYYVSSVNPDRLLFVAAGESLIYKTKDEGTHFSPCSSQPLPFTPDYLLLHPTDQDKLLAYDYRRSLLYVSEDFCANWQLVTRHVNPRFSWGVADVEGDVNTIHAEVEDIQSGGYRYMSYKPKYGDENTTSDGGIGLIDVDSLLVLGNYTFVQKSTAVDTTLYVSYRRGDFQKAYFPLDQNPLDFTIVNADEGQVFLLASHKEGHVNLYLSDHTGHFYTKSLENLVAINMMGRGVSGDVYEVESVRGTFLANQHTSGKPRTLITHNMGGIWSLLPVPTNSPNCENCNLHLHLQSSSIFHDRAMPLSEKNAPGLILAHGVVDRELQVENSSLYISRDGGLTWKESLQGDFTHNILDQGGVIVIVNITETNKQRQLWYSFDEGEHWHKFNYITQDIQVDGVLNEPGINTLTLSIFGHEKESGWIAVKVNFSTALTKKCNPDDYEPFTPSFEIGSKSNCLLGEMITYNRQKLGAECYNGEDYTHKKNTSKCDCTEEDYECDYGYVRPECYSFEACSKETCTKTVWFNPDQPLGTCEEGTKYQQSKGYRRIASDHCKNLPDKFQTVEKTCPTLVPSELKLEVIGGQIVSRGTEVTFQLFHQGSKKNTKYVWEVPGYEKVTKTGYSQGGILTHVINEHGRKEVKVTASNAEGSAYASIVVYVEDRLQGIDVMTPFGARAGQPVEFRATGLQSEGTTNTDPDVHYVWDFGEMIVDLLNRPLLTWNTTVHYTYSHYGNYSVEVQATNKLGTKFTKFMVRLYGTLVTVMLGFTDYTDEMNSETEMWRAMFADYVKKAVVEELQVSPHRLEVVTIPGPKTTVAVSFLPESQDVLEDGSLHNLADSLVQVVNKRGLKIELDSNSFGVDELINATSANILGDDDSSSGAKSRKAVWIALPVALIIIVLGVLIFVYYRRKLRGMNPRYRLLQSNSARPDNASDGLLDNEENTLDDDDEPMLDPNPNHPSSQRLTFGDNDDPLGVVIGGRGHGDIGVRT